MNISWLVCVVALAASCASQNFGNVTQDPSSKLMPPGTYKLIFADQFQCREEEGKLMNGFWKAGGNIIWIDDFGKVHTRVYVADNYGVRFKPEPEKQETQRFPSAPPVPEVPFPPISGYAGK